MIPPELVLCFLSVVLLCLPRNVSAQNYTVPSGWQNFVSNTSRAGRLSAAWGAANEVQRRVDPSMGIPTDNVYNETGSSMVTVLALQDCHSGNSSWKNQILNNTLRIYEAGNTNLDAEGVTLDIAYYGLAEVAAYLAYNDSSRLAVAKRNFDKVYNSDVITAPAAQIGTYIRALNTTCGAALGGLVFGIHANATDLTVWSSALAAWVALGAHLAELTSNTTYLIAAEQSIQFMQAHILSINFENALRISDQFDVPTYATTPGTNPFAWDVGPYIEGLSIVANVTQNATYTQMLNNLIPGVITIPEWHVPSGVLADNDEGPYTKGTLIRGLLEARLRNPSNTGLVALIDSYLTIQYNAVTQNASIGNDDYRFSWLGGDSSENPEYTTAGNIAALDVLNAAFVIGPTETSPEPPTNTTVTASPTSPPLKHSSARIGAIVGATVGGIAAVAAIIVVSCICLRRRRSNGMGNPSGPRFALEPEPFVLNAPPRDRLASTLEKGGSRQRVEYLPEIHSDMPSDPSNLSLDAAEHSSAAQSGTAVGDADALHALERRLERRLDNLIHTLAVHGETESNPPDYDGQSTGRA